MNSGCVSICTTNIDYQYLLQISTTDILEWKIYEPNFKYKNSNPPLHAKKKQNKTIPPCQHQCILVPFCKPCIIPFVNIILFKSECSLFVVSTDRSNKVLYWSWSCWCGLLDITVCFTVWAINVRTIFFLAVSLELRSYCQLNLCPSHCSKNLDVKFISRFWITFI